MSKNFSLGTSLRSLCSRRRQSVSDFQGWIWLFPELLGKKKKKKVYFALEANGAYPDCRLTDGGAKKQQQQKNNKSKSEHIIKATKQTAFISCSAPAINNAQSASGQGQNDQTNGGAAAWLSARLLFRLLVSRWPEGTSDIGAAPIHRSSFKSIPARFTSPERGGNVRFLAAFLPSPLCGNCSPGV